MTKATIIKQLKSDGYASFMSQRDICRAMKIGADKCKRLFAEVDYLQVGNTKKYLMSEVVAVMVDFMDRH